MLRANEVDVGAIIPTTALPGEQLEGCSHSQTIIPFPDPCCFRLHSSHTMGSFTIVATAIARQLASEECGIGLGGLFLFFHLLFFHLIPLKLPIIRP